MTPSSAATAGSAHPTVSALPVPGNGVIRGFRHKVWTATTALVVGVLGLAPHVLHHVTLLAGTALVAGSGGTAVFGALGLVASIPMLIKLRRRFGSWRAPALGLAVFVAMFAVSSFVVGPAISDTSDAPSPTAPVDHEVHH